MKWSILEKLTEKNLITAVAIVDVGYSTKTAVLLTHLFTVYIKPGN